MRIPADAPLLPRSERLRARMVDRQLIRRGIADARVLEAMRLIPRELFLPPSVAQRAYDDTALPIAFGQSMSQPYIVALMAEMAAIAADEIVLEIGTGSGYAAAVFSQLAARVFTIERHASLAEAAAAKLSSLEILNVSVLTGDGTEGWPAAAPFAAILSAASSASVPEAWKRQLAPGGRLVLPLGRQAGPQRLVRLMRRAGDTFDEKSFGDVMFVPLVGG